MAEAFARIAGHNVRSMYLRIPQAGRWIAEVIMADAPGLEGTLDVDVGGVMLRGTVVDSATYVDTQSFKLVGGYGGWQRKLPVRHYHNDGAGVRTLVIAQDAARESGEVLGTFEPAAERIGADYVRAAFVPACKALEDAAGGRLWWVELDGSTSVGERATGTLDADRCPLLNFDPSEQVGELGLESIADVSIGDVITQYVPTPQTIREIRITINADEPLRAKVWCGGNAQSAGRLASLLTDIARRSTDKPLYGFYRYRVTQRIGERIEAESARGDMPNVRPIAMWPGVAGAYAELAIGTEILITFIDGNPAEPVIVSFAPSGSPGFVPERLALAGTSGPAAARVGDVVKVAPASGQTITLAGAGQGAGTYTFTFQPIAVPGESPQGVLLGEIVTGSDKVEIA